MPAGGDSDPMTHSHAPRSATEPHRAGDHASGDHGQDAEHDDHGHTPETLGPIDWTAWGVGAAGVAIGLLIAAGFALSTGYLGG